MRLGIVGLCGLKYSYARVTFASINTLPVYRMLFPSKTVQKKGTDSHLVGVFSMFRAATLPEGKKNTCMIRINPAFKLFWIEKMRDAEIPKL